MSRRTAPAAKPHRPKAVNVADDVAQMLRVVSGVTGKPIQTVLDDLIRPALVNEYHKAALRIIRKNDEEA